MKVMISTPAYAGQCSMIYAESLYRLGKVLDQNKIDNQVEYICNEAIISKGRNYLAYQFMMSDCTDLLFIDADMAFNPDDVLKMINAKKDVIAGAGPRKMIEWEKIHKIAKTTDHPWPMLRHAACPMIVRPVEKHAKLVNYDEPFEVKGMGTGFMLIKRHVFEKVTAPLAKIPGPYMSEEIVVPTWFDFAIRNGQYVSEDYLFCERVREAGMKIYLAPWVQLRHIGTHIFEGCVYCSNGSFIHEMVKNG
jgi:GT2 family glycosyltransferase